MKAFFIPLSALLLSLGYFVPHYCVLLVSIFLLPLFIKVHSDFQLKLSEWLAYGFLWGICFFSVHLIFIVPALDQYATLYLRVLIYLFLVLYAAVWSAAWFFCSVLAAQYTYRSFSWIIGTWTYFLLLSRYSLIPLGFPGGYPFANPIALLAYSKQNNVLFSLVGIDFMLLICITVQMIMVILIRQRVAYGSILLYGLYIVWWLSLIKTELYTDYPISCVAPAESSDSYLDCAQNLTEDLMTIITQRANTYIIILPEGAFPYPLNHYPEIITMWFDNALHENIHLFIGAYYKENNRLYNCIYHLYQSRIIHIYRKKTLMPFTETSFTSETLDSTNTNIFKLPHLPELVVALCSDFYLNTAQYKDAQSLLLLVNDTWFMSYMQYVLYLYASAFTYEYKIELVYASYSCYTCTRSERI